jgi:hypothetical protein
MKSLHLPIHLQEVIKMKETITIDLHRGDNLQDYELNDDNLICLNVLSKDHPELSGDRYYVQLTLSVSGMIGLGTELLRKGLAAKEGRFVHNYEEPINSISKHRTITETGFGVYLAAGSADLIIRIRDLGTIDENNKKE